MRGLVLPQRCLRAVAASLLACGLAGCALAEPMPPLSMSPPDALPQLQAGAGDGAQWLQLGLTHGETGPLLAGRFRASPFLPAGQHTLLVEGRDADGALLFERRATSSGRRALPHGHRPTESHFRVAVPATPAVQTLTVTVLQPGAAAAD